MSAQAPGRAGGKGGRGSGRGTSQGERGSTVKAHFVTHSIGDRLHSLEEEQYGGQERPPVKKSAYKQTLVSLRP